MIKEDPYVKSASCNREILDNLWCMSFNTIQHLIEKDLWWPSATHSGNSHYCVNHPAIKRCQQ